MSETTMIQPFKQFDFDKREWDQEIEKSKSRLSNSNQFINFFKFVNGINRLKLIPFLLDRSLSHIATKIPYNADNLDGFVIAVEGGIYYHWNLPNTPFPVICPSSLSDADWHCEICEIVKNAYQTKKEDVIAKFKKYNRIQFGTFLTIDPVQWLKSNIVDLKLVSTPKTVTSQILNYLKEYPNLISLKSGPELKIEYDQNARPSRIKSIIVSSQSYNWDLDKLGEDIMVDCTKSIYYRVINQEREELHIADVIDELKALFDDAISEKTQPSGNESDTLVDLVSSKITNTKKKDSIIDDLANLSSKKIR